jgi:FkbM family methyltransferase
MKNKIFKLFKRIIVRLFKITSNRRLQLFLMNITTKLFFSRKNSIEYDKENDYYWLKYEGEYLFAVDKPYMNFDKQEMDQKFDSIFCFEYKPKSGDVILNIGAGIGTELTFLNRLVSNQGKIYNIEANLKSFKKLEALCKVNNFQNNFNFNLAITNFEGSLWIEDQENYRINKTNREAQGNRVEAITVDSFIMMNDISKIDFLKVNIEGAEADMVEGMSETITKVRHVSISCHDFLMDTKKDVIRKKVINFLEANNFKIVYRNTGNKIIDSWIYGEQIK